MSTKNPAISSSKGHRIRLIRPLDFNIGVETREWAWRVGLHKELGNQFEATLTHLF
jgi:hypothetical protein